MKKISIAAIILALLTTNFLSITNARFHEYLYDLISILPYDSLLKNSLINKVKSTKSLVHTVSNRIIKRTAKNVATNVGSIAAESIPFLGPATILVVTALDIKDGCDNVHDIQEIDKALGIEDVENNEDSVCGIKLPSIK
ncbi:MAG: hypothetical protein WCP01_06225 [Methylococcaceae bacterium]|jgi:hypothetical protein